MRPRLVTLLTCCLAGGTLVACGDSDLRFPVHGPASDGGGGVGGTGTGPGAPGDGGAPVSLDGFVAPAPDGGSCSVGPAGAGALIPGATMAPGTACITCHLATNGGLLYIAGTVYNDYHEPDLCRGVSDVKVQITDAKGAVHLLDVNAAGNFVDNSLAQLYPSPWTVAVVRGSLSRPMVAAVKSGDCNGCHTAKGAQNAPGRIIAPTASDSGH